MKRLNPKSPEEWREMQEDEEFLEGNKPSGRGQKIGAEAEETMTERSAV